MFLLNDVTNQLRHEIKAMIPVKNVEIRLVSVTHDLRNGEERALIELLALSSLLIGKAWGSFILELSATDDEIRASYRRTGPQSATLMPFPPSLKKKIGALGGELDENGVLCIPMPAAKDVRVIDLDEVVERTGLTHEEVHSILKGFMDDGRHNIRILTEENFQPNRETRLRAAHSLKGSGKNLCALELTEAAAAIEKSLKNGEDSLPLIQKLKRVWEHIEKWYSENSL